MDLNFVGNIWDNISTQFGKKVQSFWNIFNAEFLHTIYLTVTSSVYCEVLLTTSISWAIDSPK